NSEFKKNNKIDKKNFENITLMYVEDEKPIRDKLVLILETLFKDTVICKNGKDGYEAFLNAKSKGDKIDLIVSDINMDEMNGIEMLKHIREIDRNIPFIFTTAYSNKEYIDEASKYGVSHYAIKPINLKELLAHIYDICNTK
ncbi:MAG: response regulator, partial [Campylobacterota bacterium]|nr:response regulator [Campylobacterota bacterium]